MQRFGDKQPYEDYFLEFDFSNVIAGGDDIGSIDSVTVIDRASEEDVSSTMLTEASDYIEGASAFVRIKGGEDGHRYVVTCQVITSLLQEKYELEGLIAVRNIT